MKSIKVTYRGPTNTRGSRWLVTDCDHNRASYALDHTQNDDGRINAVRQFCAKMNWHGELVEGNLKNDWIYSWAEGDRITV